MKNTTNMTLPKKYSQFVDLVEQDEDGYWAYSKKGYMFENSGTHTAHGETQKEFLSDFRSVTKCECKDCEVN